MAGRRASGNETADWQSRLAAVMREAQARPFAAGSHDCATFAATCVVAVTGVDRIRRPRGPAERAAGGGCLSRLGGLRAAIGERPARRCWPVWRCPAG